MGCTGDTYQRSHLRGGVVEWHSAGTNVGNTVSDNQGNLESIGNGRLCSILGHVGGCQVIGDCTSAERFQTIATWLGVPSSLTFQSDSILQFWTFSTVLKSCLLVLQSLHSVKDFVTLRERILQFACGKLRQVVSCVKAELLHIERKLLLEISRLSPTR